MTDGQNIGNAIEIYAGLEGETLRFRTLKGGNNVSLRQCADKIIIETVDASIGVNLGMEGSTVFKQRVGPEFQFRRLKAGTGIGITEEADALVIAALNDSPSIVGAINLGDDEEGKPIYHGEKNGILRFKRLYAGNNVTIIDNGCSLVISAGPTTTQSAPPVSAINIGTGAGVFGGQVGNELMFKTIKGLNGTLVMDLGDEIGISAPSAPIDHIDIINIGNGTSVYSHRVDNTFRFKTLKPGPNAIITTTGDTVTIDAKVAAPGNTIGTPTTGHFDDPRAEGCKPPAITGWNENTTIADALDQLNKLLGVILPDQPPALSSKTLQVIDGQMGIVPPGTIDHTGSGPTAGQPIYVVNQTPVKTNIVTAFGSGNTGSLVAMVNGQAAGSVALNAADNTGTYDALEVLADSIYPVGGPACLWRSIDARITMPTLNTGINSVQLVHTQTGSTNRVFFLLEDASVVVPAISIGNASATEGGVIEFTVNLSVPTTVIVSVSYQTQDGTAVGGQDYTAKSGILQFQPGETVKKIQINTTDDLLVEGNEAFKIILSDPVNATLATSQGSGTIVDNDQDSISGLPVFENRQITEGNQVIVYSSSVPHYASTSTLKVTASYSNMVTHGGAYATPMIEAGTNPQIGIPVVINAGEYGIPASPSGTVITASDVPFIIGGSIHTTSKLRTRGKNTNGYGDWSEDTIGFNVMAGSPPSGVNGPMIENGISLVNLGVKPTNAPDFGVRVTMGNGDTPADDKSGLLTGDWNASAALNTWDAAIVGGVLRCDHTNYSDGYLPVGPDLSGQNATQYTTFMVRRSAVTSMLVDITGTYSGCWLKMYGLTDPFTGDLLDLSDAPNGWWDAMMDFDAVGGVPGMPGTSPGCGDPSIGKMNGHSGTFGVTFGQANTHFSTNNILLVRFKLTGNDAISGLVFRGN